MPPNKLSSFTACVAFPSPSDLGEMDYVSLIFVSASQISTCYPVLL
jgi:hypothetical protein